MRGGGFTFKQFHIDHSRCAMKVGTDGTLLGAWATRGAPNPRHWHRKWPDSYYDGTASPLSEDYGNRYR